LAERLTAQAPRIQRLEFSASPDVYLSPGPVEFGLPHGAIRDLELDQPTAG